MSRTFGRVSFDADAFYSSLVPEWTFAPTCIVAPYAAHHIERYNELLQQLTDIQSLADNWDGYGGAAIARSAIDQARRLLGAHLRSVGGLGFPEIIPTSNGTVALEWQEGSGEAVIEIGAERITGFVKPQSGDAFLLGGEGDQYSEHLPILVDACISQDTAAAASINQVEYDSVANG